jgi:hypothetical protein
MTEHAEVTHEAIETAYEAELEALKEVSNAFAKLDEDARKRVWIWIASRFGIRDFGDSPYEKMVPNNGQRGPAIEHEIRGAAPDSTAFQYPAELFDAARPKTDVEKALVLAYWFQVCQGNPSFSSRQVNDELKHMGHGVSNITRALDGLIDAKPALVIQLEKSGKSQQAQKKFKVTHEGVKRVQQMLTGSDAA